MHVTLCEVHNIQNPMTPQRHISQALAPLPRKDAERTVHTMNTILIFHCACVHMVLYIQHADLKIRKVQTTAVLDFQDGVEIRDRQITVQRSHVAQNVTVISTHSSDSAVLEGLPCNRDF